MHGKHQCHTEVWENRGRGRRVCRRVRARVEGIYLVHPSNTPRGLPKGALVDLNVICTLAFSPSSALATSVATRGKDCFHVQIWLATMAAGCSLVTERPGTASLRMARMAPSIYRYLNKYLSMYLPPSCRQGGMSISRKTARPQNPGWSFHTVPMYHRLLERACCGQRHTNAWRQQSVTYAPAGQPPRSTSLEALLLLG